MNGNNLKEEHLEKLWHMKEQGSKTMDVLRDAMAEDFSSEIFGTLVEDGLVEMGDDGVRVVLSAKGEDYARRIIRAHRLAERLFKDVLGCELESGACEFEHVVTPEIVDAICTLLSHPHQCPHGMPIPEGECCRRSAETIESRIISLAKLDVGQTARVAYINACSDRHLHKLDCLQIRPGAIVRLHQKHPSIVIKCEGGMVALDEEIAGNICVWKEINGHSFVDKESATKANFGRFNFFSFKRKK